MAKQTNCCPEFVEGKKCDYLDFVYRLNHQTDVRLENRAVPVTVETAIHIRVERCTGPLQMGNLVYSTTLLPGEKVRLFTSDRRSRFSFDTESQLSYRHEQSSEERYYMDSMDSFMSDLESKDTTHSSSNSSGSASSKGGTSGFFESLFSGPSVSVSGSYNAASTRDFIRELGVHAQSSHNRSVQMTREANSTQVGEVQTRTHVEGESESHFESSSRLFENKNQCHAVTYLFYQIDKQQTTKVSVKAVNLRVVDQAGRTDVVNNPVVGDRKLSVIPAAVLATKAAEPEKLKLFEASVLTPAQRYQIAPFALSASQSNQRPLENDIRNLALANVRNELMSNGVLDKSGQVSKEVSAELNFEFSTSIPTAGVMVKGCLDDCSTCEDARKISIELDLKHKELRNQLLARKIELLEKSQEYRCCPESECEEVEEA
ncbi:hypothetical protein [Reinekea sp. G2M2-21]|uniref:hypothetical protein n=1 Tax=Reinekea sp. G2M2-21 TaxID=2788942 RepID=UPI0018AB1798|nr:hypothetical protein [Reinekea sp. G2M2-21]